MNPEYVAYRRGMFTGLGQVDYVLIVGSVQHATHWLEAMRLSRTELGRTVFAATQGDQALRGRTGRFAIIRSMPGDPEPFLDLRERLGLNSHQLWDAVEAANRINALSERRP